MEGATSHTSSAQTESHTDSLEKLRGRRVEFGKCIKLVEMELMAIKSEAADDGGGDGDGNSKSKSKGEGEDKAPRPPPLETLIRRLFVPSGIPGAAFHPLIHIGTFGLPST